MEVKRYFCMHHNDATLCVFLDFQNFPKLYVKRGASGQARVGLLTAPPELELEPVYSL